MARRHLGNPPDKARQHGFQLIGRRHDRARGQDLTLGVAGRRRQAEPQRRNVGLIRVEQKLRELGRFAEADRQQPRGQRIERPGMACLLGAIQALRPLQRGVGRKTPGLVEQQHAIETAARTCRGHQPSGCLRSSATASSISFDNRRPDSIESSYAK